MKTSIVIINWNGREKLEKFLPAILKVEGVSEFILSDDASSDDSVTFVKETYPEVKVFVKTKNGGFSTNANFGVSHSQGDLVFLLNPDAVPDKDCVTKSLKYFQDLKVFSVGCNTGGNWSWARFKNGYFWHYAQRGIPQTHQTLWARGGSGIFRRSTWDELGGMDEMFNPFYEEDTDLGYRATKRGYLNIWAEDCKVTLPSEDGVIEENISKPVFSKIAQRNQLLFIWKNIADSDLVKEHRRFLLKRLISHPKYWWVFLQALRKWSEVMKKRDTEMKKQILSDRQILLETLS